MNRRRASTLPFGLITLILLCCLVIFSPGLSWADGIDWGAGGQMEKDGREGLSAFFGYLALIFFILANLYTPAKWIVKHKLVQDVQVLRKKLKTLFQIHVQCNIMMFIFAIIHAHYSSQINFFLVVPMLIFAWLIFGGAFMMTRLRMHKEFREYVRMLHAQQYLFWVAIVFLIIGHIIIG